MSTSSQKLKTVFLGNTGIKVSELCLGAMTFNTTGNSWMGMPVIGKAESFELLDYYASVGGNFIDTANAYSNGDSEVLVGQWLKTQNRNDYVIATKGFFRTGPGANSLGASRSNIIQSVEDSLKRLDSPYIDLYQLHMWDAGTPIKETLTTLNDLVRCGKIRYIGASNYTGWQLQKALDYAKFIGLECMLPSVRVSLLESHRSTPQAYISLQAEYSLLCRSPEFELFPLCEAEGVGYLPWSPLKGGWLSGKFKRDIAAPGEGRVAWAQQVGWKETDFASHANEKTWGVLDAVEGVAKEIGATPAQVSLRWTLQRPGVTSTIIGARNMAQLKDNIGAAFIQLSPEQMEKLNTASAIEFPYPYGLINSHNAHEQRNR